MWFLLLSHLQCNIFPASTGSVLTNKHRSCWKQQTSKDWSLKALAYERAGKNSNHVTAQQEQKIQYVTHWLNYRCPDKDAVNHLLKPQGCTTYQLLCNCLASKPISQLPVTSHCGDVTLSGMDFWSHSTDQRKLCCNAFWSCKLSLHPFH